jgi:hypothetical protein
MYINKFSEFLSENKNSIDILKKFADESGQYINLNILPNGNLEISLTEEGKEELEELEDNVYFYDFIEDIRGNSSWIYVDDLADYGFMSNAPAMLFQYDMDEDGEISVNIYEDGEVFYYPNYAIYDFVDKLKTEGSVIFDRIIVSPEEQKEYDINKEGELYNL